MESDTFLDQIISGEAPPLVQYEPGIIDRLLPFFTYEHEVEHFRIMSCSPFGLAIWRSFQSLHANILFLHKHFSEDIFVEFEKLAQPRYADYLESKGDGKSREDAYVDMVCWECMTLREFISAMLVDNNLTKKQFVDLATSAEQILSKRSGLKSERKLVVAKDQQDEPLIPRGILSPMEIMEATAMLHEEIILRSIGHDATDIRYWERRNLTGIYERAHTSFRNWFGYIIVGKIAGDLCFQGPSDIATQQGDVDIGSFYPSLRLEKLIKHVSGKTYSHELYSAQNKSIPLDEDVFDGSVKRTLTALLDSELWNDNFISRGSDKYWEKDQPDDSVKIQLCVSDMRKNMLKSRIRERLDSYNLSLSTGLCNTQFTPLLTVFSNELSQFGNQDKLIEATADRMRQYNLDPEDTIPKIRIFFVTEFIHQSIVYKSIFNADPIDFSVFTDELKEYVDRVLRHFKLNS